MHDFTLAQDSSTTTLIGSNDTTPLLPFDTDGFYINTARPAVQNGTISSLNYCYYGRQDNSKNRYQSLVAVYRPTGVRGIYISISDTIIISKLTPALTVPQADTLIRGFNCDYYELQESVQVLKGDVIGACIYDTSNIGQLDLLSQTSEGYTLLVDSAHNADCDKGVLPSIIRGDSLEGTTRRGILHVSAEICKSLIYTDVLSCMEYGVHICWHSHGSQYSNPNKNGVQQCWYKPTGCIYRRGIFNKFSY